MNKYYGYARVSTKDQSDNSIDNQLKYLEIKANEASLEYVGYSEKKSGKNISGRIELQKILASIKSGDILGVYDNSRLGRDTQENLQIANELSDKKVTLQISGKNIDIDNPQDELLLTIESAVSAFQRKQQNLKSRIGIKTKKEKGDWVFTSRILGYDTVFKNSKPEITVNETEAEILRYLFIEYSKGKSTRQITLELNSKGYRSKDGKTFSIATMRRYILKPIYMGYYLKEAAGGGKGQDKVKIIDQDQLIKSNLYPVIISPELWWKCYRSYKEVPRKHAIQFEHRWTAYELSSIIKCGHCNKIDPSRQHSYVHSYRKYGKSVMPYYVNYTHISGCGQKTYSLQERVVEGLFKLSFFLLFYNPLEIYSFIEEKENEINELSRDHENDLNRINNLLNNLTNKKENIANAISQGINVEIVKNQLQKIETEENELENEKQNIESIIKSANIDIEEYYESFKEDTLEKYITAIASKKREIYLKMLDNSEIKDQFLFIQYKNNKQFKIKLLRNRGRYIQKTFKIDISYNGKNQYSLLFNVEDWSIEVITPDGIKKEFQKNYYEDLENQISIFVNQSIELEKEVVNS